MKAKADLLLSNYFLKNKFALLLFCSLLTLLTSCDPNRIFEENQKMENRSWEINAPVIFNVTIDDTISAYNMYINIRNSDKYKFSNLYLFMTTTIPKRQFEKDTLQLLLADENGKWLGNGLGDIFESRVLFKKNIRFLYKGNYQFKLEQAMRIDPLPGVLDVGIRIEKANQ